MQLYDFQLEALQKIKNGCILNGDTGSGKTLTALAYYYMQQGGSINFLKGGDYVFLKNPKDLYIITPAQKRDIGEWEVEMLPFLFSSNEKESTYSNKVVIDSWNNIKKYKNVTSAFFIFDEDRVTGNGVWVKSFLKITKRNKWIILSATPGDCYMDYWAVFVANGFYKNKTEFTSEHVIYSRFTSYPQIDRYVGTKKLDRLKNSILIPMNLERNITYHHEDVICNYNIKIYKDVMKRRWDIYNDKPIQQASSLCYILQKIVNSDEDRLIQLDNILKDKLKVIIFYNFNYERDILLDYISKSKFTVSEWSGHAHQPIPKTKRWIYLVQYAAGNSAWNCTKTDTIIFFSQNYSYKTLHQACGRIDRLNTPFKDLYYYHFKSKAPIDIAISKSLKDKKEFNERKFAKW